MLEISELSLQQFTCTNGFIKTKLPVEESGETINFYGKIVWAHYLEHEGKSAIYLSARVQLSRDFLPCSSVSITDFEQIVAGGEVPCKHSTL